MFDSVSLFDLLLNVIIVIIILFSSVTQSCPTLRPHELQHARPPLSISNLWSSPKLMSIALVMPSNHLILCCPLLPPSIFPSIRVFSSVSSLYQVAKVLECLYFSPSNEYSELISFRIDWLDLLAVQGSLKSLRQDHSSKASILQFSTFLFGPTLTSIMTTGKTIALTIWTFVRFNKI